MNHVWYMVSSIIMDGAKDSRKISDAREIAKDQARLLAVDKEYSDMCVTIDKYNDRTHVNILVETWKYDPIMDIFTRSRNCPRR